MSAPPTGAMATRPSRERAVWRALVLAQLVVLAIIVLSLLTILAIGNLSALFSQQALSG